MKTPSKKQDLVQLPFRCNPELHVRIIRALGLAMTRSGKKVSKNEFVVRLIETGLRNFDDVAEDQSIRISR